MICISIDDRWVESVEVIEKFLRDMREPLINDKLILQNRRDNKNTQTLLELEFDRSDLIQELLGLRIENYLYTAKDRIKPHENPYNVFYKEIKHLDIYIKIKIKEVNKKILYCMSFHEAEYKESNFPYE